MMTRSVCFALLVALLGACTPPALRDAGPADAPPLMTWRDVQRMAEPPDALRLDYGPEPSQFGELRLPPGVPGPFPVLVLVHGACWGEHGDYRYMRPLAEALSTLGVATWTIEYRGAGGAGGGWPGTFQDVARATDHLRELARSHPLDLKRVVAAGHGTGGQLALWLASRSRIGADSALHVARPLKIHGVIGLAAVTDLETFESAPACPEAVAALLGGDSAPDRAGRRKQVSPRTLLPLGVPQWFVHGARDGNVPDDGLLSYAELARRKGDKVTVGVTSDAGHYEPVVPASATWMTLQQAVIAALLM